MNQFHSFQIFISLILKTYVITLFSKQAQQFPAVKREINAKMRD